MPKSAKLLYLPMRGRAECIRMYLKFCDMWFEDEVLDYEAFALRKLQGDFPFDQVRWQPCELRTF